MQFHCKAKMSSDKPNPKSDLHSLCDRLKNMKNIQKEPDSPISPFQFRTSRGITSCSSSTSTTTSSSSSSSYDSVSGIESRTDLLRKSPSVKSKPSYHHHYHRTPVNIPPFGNIIPSGRIVKSAIMNQPSKPSVVRSGSSEYGHGSIVPRNFSQKPSVETGPIAGLGNRDAEEFRKQGNQSYTKGDFAKALKFYDKAITLSPSDPTLHFNRSSALISVNRVVEAAQECENAIVLDQVYVKAHQRLGSLFLRLGQIENARMHIYFGVHNPNSKDFEKLECVEKHLIECSDARRVGDWRRVLREMDAATASGADASPQFFACKAEALLKLFALDDSISMLSKIDMRVLSTSSESRIFGMSSIAFIFLVRSQIELARGKFDDALNSIENAAQRDPHNAEISTSLNNVKLVARARSRGNDLFKSNRLTEACAAYAEGLRIDPRNSILYCNRAACWFKLRKWERSVDDCNQALRIDPGYTKALLRRAAAYLQLERWSDAVNDFEVLSRDFPCDNEIAASLSDAQMALKRAETGEEDVRKLQWLGVMSVTNLQQLKTAVSSPGASVAYFRTSSNVECEQISPFFNTICTKYPSVNFMQVDIDAAMEIARVEEVRVVPTFKIYRKGKRVKEMLCPSKEMLELSVRDYCL